MIDYHCKIINSCQVHKRNCRYQTLAAAGLVVRYHFKSTKPRYKREKVRHSTTNLHFTSCTRAHRNSKAFSHLITTQVSQTMCAEISLINTFSTVACLVLHFGLLRRIWREHVRAVAESS